MTIYLSSQEKHTSISIIQWNECSENINFIINIAFERWREREKEGEREREVSKIKLKISRMHLKIKVK